MGGEPARRIPRLLHPAVRDDQRLVRPGARQRRGVAHGAGRGEQCAQHRRHVDAAALQEAEGANVTREALLDGNTLTNEQRGLVDRYFNPRFRREDGSVDVVALMTDTAVERLFASRREGLVQGLTSHFEGDGDLSTGAIERLVGGEINRRIGAINVAMFGHQGSLNPFSGAGTDESAIYSELSGLTPIQMIGLRKAYRVRYGRSLESDLKTELSGSEMDRARDLLSGDVIAAAAAALHTAMHGVNWVHGQGTDEAGVHAALRSVPAEQRAELERVYNERYGRNLSADLEAELNDWSTLSTSEADRADAERRGRDREADAIEMHQLATETWFHTNTVGEMEAVYTRIDSEVEAEVARARAQGVHYSSAWVANEIARRRREVETLHDARFATTNAAGATTGTLRDGFNTAATGEMMFWGSSPEHRDAGATMLNALADNNNRLAEASRLRLERTSLVYADDDVITGTYRSHYTRALTEVRRDREDGIRRRLTEELERREAAMGRRMTPEERFAAERDIDRRVERELQKHARRLSEGRVAAMESAYEAEYHEPASVVVEENTSGVDRAIGRSARAQGGYLSPFQQLEYASRGDGTREEAMAAATVGLTPSEIRDLDARWQATHRNDDGTPQTLQDLGNDELSGDDLHNYRVSLHGVPQTIDEEIALAEERMRWYEPTSGAGENIATTELGLMREQYEYLARMRDGMRRTDLSRAERDRYVRAFRNQTDIARTAVTTYRDERNAIVDELTTMIGVVIGVIVGAILTVFTGGLAGAVLIAVIGSLLSTAATMTTKYLLLGNSYGAADIGLDLALGLVDAVVSGLTAGMGGRLLGEVAKGPRQLATTVAARGMRGALQRAGLAVGRGVSRVSSAVGHNEGLITRSNAAPSSSSAPPPKTLLSNSIRPCCRAAACT